MEYNQIGRKSIAKVRARTRHPIKALQSQSVELPCVFPFSEKDFIQVALRSPHAAQEVKSSGALYLSRIFSYQLLVDNSNSYRSGCEGTMTVRLMTPPCVHISGKVLLYRDAGSGQGATASSGVAAGGRASLGFGPEEPTSPPLAFNWLANGENETEFNCSLFYPGRNEYCFRFVFNFSRSSSPAHTCLVVHRSTGEKKDFDELAELGGNPKLCCFCLSFSHMARKAMPVGEMVNKSVGAFRVCFLFLQSFGARGSRGACAV